MKKNLLNLLAIGLITSLFVGCGGDSSNTTASKPQVVVPAECIITQSSAVTSLVGEVYTPACIASTGVTCVVNNTDSIDINAIAVYPLAFTADGCTDTNGTIEIKQPAPSGLITSANVLPF